MSRATYQVGIDIGSTTIKFVVLDERKQMIYEEYRRHLSDVHQTLKTILAEAYEQLDDLWMKPVITGSGGIDISASLSIPFEQEVIAATRTIETFIPEADVAIELGGEDAKITYFEPHGVDQRMNSSCAGGTGAFIDQMATLLETDAMGLNELAKSHRQIYPIASRCGVFAKTDVQPLLNEGASKQDIAASIFQAVVNQTISGLSCGKPIRGNVAFLGGPFKYLSSLRELFMATLKLNEQSAISPADSHLFVAQGAALLADQHKVEVKLSDLIAQLNQATAQARKPTDTMPPLFTDKQELVEFRQRHVQATLTEQPLENYQGQLFLGIDAGSTTTKVVVIGEQNELLYTYYGHNKGNPLNLLRTVVQEIYERMNPAARIVNTAVTGYGEQLIKAALQMDIGEVETVAHYAAAKHFLPEVEFILDIGGQDMKCITIKDGAIHNISLNEACSAGCGSFIEMFAESLQMPVQQFSEQALLAEHPVNLGTRCTVFMNSKVKQAQKEGAAIGDISAGLSYSVIRNALYKVIKLKRLEHLPQHIMVQGGTFNNLAVLRAFEQVTQREVVRPTISGMMGAFGAALIAKEQYDPSVQSTFVTVEELVSFTVDVSYSQCKLCGNACKLTISTFDEGRTFVSGNRCERGAGGVQCADALPNLYQYKYDRLFDYTSLKADEAKRGTIGIPRVLNIYENYPFWHRFFTKLGFRVMLSPKSSKKIYERGIDSIPSESICYPAKLVHGHIEMLISRKADIIFYPSVAYEYKEMEKANLFFNCPVVTSYPEVIRTNMDSIRAGEVKFMNPFVTFNNRKALKKVLYREFMSMGMTEAEVSAAVEEGWAEQQQYRADIQAKGLEVLAMLQATGKRGIVLSGRPYHVDPEIHHGIDRVIIDEGMAVLTEDSIAHLGEGLLQHPLRVVDQWVYHSRLYAASAFVGQHANLEMVQLTSFGCGIDAVTTDQVQDILSAHGKTYTLIKIDEGSNLGAARIRVRSLKAAMKDREAKGASAEYGADDRHALATFESYIQTQVPFTEEMRETYTILAPQMSPIHFQFIEPALESEGYRLKVLSHSSQRAIEEGLNSVNNDACYPSIIVTGQILEALKSGEYDLDKTAVIISQTGGGCRATNYIAFIRKALADAGMPNIPVISLNVGGIEENPGFKLGVNAAKKLVLAILYGDLLMRVLYATRPYERYQGSADQLTSQWQYQIVQDMKKASIPQFIRNVKQIVKEFDELHVLNTVKPKVGVVGEILVKFHPLANNQLVDLIEAEGGEAVVPDLMDFFLYCAHSFNFDRQNYGTGILSLMGGNAIVHLIEGLRNAMRKALLGSKRFTAPVHISHLARYAEDMLSLGNQTGEGWLLTAEMIELLEMDVHNIVCVQPFACLPNHITGKGMMKELKSKYPYANIAAIDYDPGVSEVNQLNRLKLMMSTAFKKLDKAAVPSKHAARGAQTSSESADRSTQASPVS